MWGEPNIFLKIRALPRNGFRVFQCNPYLSRSEASILMSYLVKMRNILILCYKSSNSNFCGISLSESNIFLKFRLYPVFHENIGCYRLNLFESVSKTFSSQEYGMGFNPHSSTHLLSMILKILLRY